MTTNFTAATAANDDARLLAAPTIFHNHAWASPRTAAWLEHVHCDPEKVMAAIEMREMRGVFVLDAVGRAPTWTFVPRSDGFGRAVVLPLVEAGSVIDLLAISKHDRRIWATVTGAGRVAGFDQIGASPEPLRVHDRAWTWLAENCVGVLPLRPSAFAELARAPALLAGNIDHAEELAERIFIQPAENRAGATYTSVINAELEAAERIFFEDVPEDIADRAAVQAVRDARTILGRRAGS